MCDVNSKVVDISYHSACSVGVVGCDRCLHHLLFWTVSNVTFHLLAAGNRVGKEMDEQLNLMAWCS